MLPILLAAAVGPCVSLVIHTSTVTLSTCQIHMYIDGNIYLDGNVRNVNLTQ